MINYKILFVKLIVLNINNFFVFFYKNFAFFTKNLKNFTNKVNLPQ